VKQTLSENKLLDALIEELNRIVLSVLKLANEIGKVSNQLMERKIDLASANVKQEE
jgi:hypothetical protein